MSTDSPAGYDPDVWTRAVTAAADAQVALLRQYPLTPNSPEWMSGQVAPMGATPYELAEVGLRAALAVLEKGN